MKKLTVLLTVMVAAATVTALSIPDVNATIEILPASWWNHEAEWTAEVCVINSGLNYYDGDNRQYYNQVWGTPQQDAAGNDFIKAHMSSSAGTVDGRIYSGYQILNGSLGEDLIFAGADGSQLWGNADTAADTLVGGDGSDIFISGKNEGSDTFQNASAADVINLNDTSLSDIVSTNTRDGALVISFNTGNTLTVQSTEALSANIIFSDGTNRRFNHATNSWQTA